MKKNSSHRQPPKGAMPPNSDFDNGPTEQERAASAVNEALQILKANNAKRKRDGPGSNGPAEDPRRPASKRVSASNQMNGNGHDSSDPSGSSFLPSSASTSNDFSTLSQQLAHHASRTNQENASSTAAAALAGIMPSLTIPQPTELSFASTASGSDGERQLDPSFDLGGQDNGQSHHPMPYNLPMAAQVQAAREASSAASSKPPVGSEEWQKVRRDNHKEVERRRRETINEGINELAKIVPGCEKNKGSILQKAVTFITQLKEAEAVNIEKWTLEKLLTEQALAELSASVTKLKTELERAWREAEMWKKTCQDAGLEPQGGGDTEVGNES